MQFQVKLSPIEFRFQFHLMILASDSIPIPIPSYNLVINSIPIQPFLKIIEIRFQLQIRNRNCTPLIRMYGNSSMLDYRSTTPLLHRQEILEIVPAFIMFISFTKEELNEVFKSINTDVTYCEVPGSPCLSKTGPVYGPFFFLKFLGNYY